MIEEEKYEQILKEGLILDHYLLLCNIKNGVKPLNNKRVQGFINLLTKKDYLKEDALTEKGLALVEDCILTEVVATQEKKKMSHQEWVAGLYERIQAKMKELTGSTQMRATIDKKPYSFVPNVADLSKVLLRAITAYKLKDDAKIEKVIMSYITTCAEKKSWFPILQYYIMKDGMSKLVTDIENGGEESEPEFKSTQKFV